MSELKLITSPQLPDQGPGLHAAGATMPINIITADDAKARIAHHQAELEKAWVDYYGPTAVRNTLANCTARAVPTCPEASDGPLYRVF